ncbi:MAG: hypothetical protein AABW51_03585 [Nanoarchaeota archaeon]
MVKTIDKTFESIGRPSRKQYIPLYGIIEAMKANGNGESSIMPDGKITLAGMYQATLYALVVGSALNYLFPK